MTPEYLPAFFLGMMFAAVMFGIWGEG